MSTSIFEVTHALTLDAPHDAWEILHNFTNTLDNCRNRTKLADGWFALHVSLTAHTFIADEIRIRKHHGTEFPGMRAMDAMKGRVVGFIRIVDGLVNECVPCVPRVRVHSGNARQAWLLDAKVRAELAQYHRASHEDGKEINGVVGGVQLHAPPAPKKEDKNLQSACSSPDKAPKRKKSRKSEHITGNQISKKGKPPPQPQPPTPQGPRGDIRSFLHGHGQHGHGKATN